MGDFYKTLGELKADEVEGVDYEEMLEDKSSKVTILSIHGGFIEYGTTEIAREIVKNGFNYFNFGGLKKRSWRLHVTSHRFYHEGLEDLLKKSDTAISIHGCYLEDLKEPAVCIGGMNEKLKTLVKIHLEGAGFKVDLGHFPAAYDRNIVNRTKSYGVQLELTRALRESFFKDFLKSSRKPNKDFYIFTDIVCLAIDKYLEL